VVRAEVSHGERSQAAPREANPVAPTLFRDAEKQKEKTLDENHSWFEPE
jgi:hypothetical protein